MRLEPGWGTALAVVGAHLALGHLLVYQSLLGNPLSWQGVFLYIVLSLWITLFSWYRLRLRGPRMLAVLPLSLVSGGTIVFLIRARKAGAGWGSIALAALLLLVTAGFGVAVLSIWASRLERRMLLDDLFTP